MKTQADSHPKVKQSDFRVGDKVLLKQRKRDKLTTSYETVPYTVEEVKGSQVTASNHIHQVCRHANLFKKLPRRVLANEGEPLDELPDQEDTPIADEGQGQNPDTAPDPQVDREQGPQRTTTQDAEQPRGLETVPPPEPHATNTPMAREMASSEATTADDRRRTQRRNIRPPVRFCDPDWQ